VRAVKEFLPFIVVGLSTGSIYGLAGMGLVLTYKTSGIFNFAHGAVATAAAYIFYELRTVQGLPWPVAALVCLVAIGVAGGIVLQRVARDLADVPPAMKVVATVGLVIFIQSLFVAIYGPEAREFPPFLPTRTVGIAGANFGVDQFILMAIALFSAGALYAFFRSSRLGIAMRGVVDDADLTELSGTSASAVRTWAWTIGSAFAAMSGILLGPSIGLDAFLLTLLVVQAFGAAAIGAFSSLPMTYVGGLAIGVAAALSSKYVPSFRVLSGLPPSLPFIALFGFLLFTRNRLPVEAATRPLRRAEAERTWPPFALVAGPLILLGLLLAVPALVGSRLPVYTSGLVYVIVFASLALLVRTSGQVSLSHAAFVAVGAAAFSHLAHGAGAPWLIAVVGAGLATVPVAALLAIPTIRLSGIYLALATFGFGILLQRMVFSTGLMFGSSDIRPAPRPAGFTTDTAYYYVVLAIVGCAAALIFALHRTRLGRILRAMADSPIALATHGTNVNITRVLVFCISAFLAGIAGALVGGTTGTIGGRGFGPFESLLWLVLLAISGAGILRASFVAAFLVAVLPSYIFRWEAAVDYLPVSFGLSAVVIAMMASGRYDLTAWFRRAAQRADERASRSPAAERLREAS
jgi:branched-subunit amino acid ABC-type transport system permease component